MRLSGRAEKQLSALSRQRSAKIIREGYVSRIDKDEVSHAITIGEFQFCAAIFVIFYEPNWFSDNLRDCPLVLRREVV